MMMKEAEGRCTCCGCFLTPDTVADYEENLRFDFTTAGGECTDDGDGPFCDSCVEDLQERLDFNRDFPEWDDFDLTDD